MATKFNFQHNTSLIIVINFICSLKFSFYTLNGGLIKVVALHAEVASSIPSSAETALKGYCP